MEPERRGCRAWARGRRCPAGTRGWCGSSGSPAVMSSQRRSSTTWGWMVRLLGIDVTERRPVAGEAAARCRRAAGIVRREQPQVVDGPALALVEPQQAFGVAAGVDVARCRPAGRPRRPRGRTGRRCRPTARRCPRAPRTWRPGWCPGSGTPGRHPDVLGAQVGVPAAVDVGEQHARPRRSGGRTAGAARRMASTWWMGLAMTSSVRRSPVSRSNAARRVSRHSLAARPIRRVVGVAREQCPGTAPGRRG